MPVSGSVWTALIAAAAAVAGVLIAQAWATRREERNWKHQLQMYATQWEDQRQRDAEQREDQRQRDRELWEREDRHRFTQDKRALYGDLLSEAAEAQPALSYVEGAHIFGEDVKPNRLNSHRERLTSRSGKIDLVAPDDICEQAREVRAAFILATSALNRKLFDGSPERDTQYIQREAELRREIEKTQECHAKRSSRRPRKLEVSTPSTLAVDRDRW